MSLYYLNYTLKIFSCKFENGETKFIYSKFIPLTELHILLQILKIHTQEKSHLIFSLPIYVLCFIITN